MTHQEIEQLVKRCIIDSAQSEANPRVQEIVYRLVSDLFKAIEDLDMSATEVWKGIEFLQDAGKNMELGLISPGIGLDHFLDLRFDEAEAKLGIDGGTPRTIEGPLYVEGAPEAHGFARLDDGSEAEEGKPLFMQGTVYGADGKPLANSKVEVWHANLLGNYSFFDKSQPDFNLRRTIITDENGRYQFQSIVPAGYGCPPDGSTLKLLGLLGRHGRRPAHIHFFVTAEGHRKLTTQINIDGDEYLWDDFAFASREGLVPEVKEVTDADQIAKLGLSKPFASIDFDFHLNQEVAAAPSTDVDRRRAG